MYLVVSGGAYGLEDAVRMAGPRLTLMLCLIVPLTLSLPTALMAAELTALMPVEGGFYFWVKEALGPLAGFAEAYLTILYTAVDMAIYPVLFAGYLSFILPLGPTAQIAIGVALVWLAGGLNFLGVRPVGMASIVLAAILVSPFAALVIVGIPRLIHFTMPTPPLFGADPWGAMAAGLTVVIWNFSGWENLSVVSAEIENPRRNYLRAILIALPIIVAGYVLPLAVSVSGAVTAADWGTGSFSHAGYAIGGPGARRRAGARRRGDVVRGVRGRDAVGVADAVRARCASATCRRRWPSSGPRPRRRASRFCCAASCSRCWCRSDSSRWSCSTYSSTWRRLRWSCSH